MTTEDRERLIRAYRRAGLGLALGALLWMVALLFARAPEDGKGPWIWIIPICAAALSVLCFSRYNQYRK
jgi:hypothetical protein